jgi:hypothetical protein
MPTNMICLLLEICMYCCDDKLILPSLEAFEMGIDIPSVYFMFYDFFFKSSVGDSRWKRSCSEEVDAYAPLGTVHAEAFAMLQLKNNYFAWLLEAKEKFGDQLVTDYDLAHLQEGKMSAAQKYLGQMELNVQGSMDEELVLFSGEKYEELQMTTDGKLSECCHILTGDNVTNTLCFVSP